MQGGEVGVADERKRDWLFPVILGLLLAGSVGSFALAFTGRIVQHQELKISSDHGRASPGTAALEVPH